MRVFDLLRDYTPVEQAVVVYAAQTAVDSLNPNSSWVTVWAGRCISWSKTFDGVDDELTFNVESNPVEVAYRTKRIDTGTGRPDSSIGKILPLILGTAITVPAYPIAEDNNPYWSYGFATSLSTQYTIPTVNQYFAQCEDGYYREVDTGVVGTFYGNDVAATGANYPTPQGITERLVKINRNASTENKGVIGGRWRFRGQNNGALAPSGRIQFSLYVANVDDAASYPRPIMTQVRTAFVEKSDYYTQLRSASDFYVEFRFQEVYWDGRSPDGGTLVPSLPTFYIGMVLSQYAGAGVDFEDGGVSTTSGTYFYRVGQQGVSEATSGTTPYAQVTGLELIGASTISPSDQDGLRINYFYVNPGTAPTGQTNPDISNLDLQVEVDGIRDDVSGTITGTPSQVITYPHHAIQLLTLKWNGSTWASSSDWDHTAFSSRYSTIFTSTYKWRRSLGGFSSGDSSAEDLAANISEEMAGYIVQRINGKLAWWPWGVENVSSIRTFTDDTIRVLDWSTLDASSVVNQVYLSYSRGTINGDDKAVIAGNEIPNFDTEINWYYGANSYATFLTTASNALYGRRNLDERSANWINDSTSAQTYADFILRTYDHPHRIMRMEVPFWENYDLQLLDIIELLSAAAPARKGTCASARLPTYNGTEVDPIQGNYWRRAQRYRMQIISRDVNFQRGERPTLVLTCRVIKPYHPNDPT